MPSAEPLLAKADELLHGKLAQMSGNLVVTETLERLFVRSRAFRIFYAREGAADLTRDEHESIVRAVVAGDGPAAADAMTTPLRSARERMLAALP
ncbi:MULTISPECIES: FCD domain-containing protein [unclassified Nonomuraea]|uniref:FCD domain-containing protein n=1 Tax=unclassified Nonomuraea TaxID=2593643 RepID=UPI0033F53406